jgi:phosphoribosyl-AMP cyclohydrolase
VLVRVDQTGVACHTGRRNCFFRVARDGAWHTDLPVLQDPEDLYGHRHE